jgi:hypothetical protein
MPMVPVIHRCEFADGCIAYRPKCEIAGWVARNPGELHTHYKVDPIEELNRLQTELTDAQRKLEIATEALDTLACWNEGPEVTGSFDDPPSATLAREALAEIRRGDQVPEPAEGVG